MMFARSTKRSFSDEARISSSLGLVVRDGGRIHDMRQEGCEIVHSSRVTGRVDGRTLRSLLLSCCFEDRSVYDYGRFFPSSRLEQLQHLYLCFAHPGQTISLCFQYPL